MSEILKVESETNPLIKDEVKTELEKNIDLPIDHPDYDAQQGPLATFALYGPMFFKLVGTLSNRQMRRLLNSLATWPLENIEVNKKNPNEYEAWKIGERLVECKVLLKLQQGYEEMERRKAATEEHKKALESSAETKNAFDEAAKQAAKEVPLNNDKEVSLKEEKN